MDREPGGGKGMARATDNSRPGWLAEGVLIGVIVVSVGAANLPVSGQLVVPAPSDTGEARGQQAGAESQPADVQVAATGQPLAAPEAADPTTTPAADAEPASEPEATDQVVASQTAAEREGPASPDSPDGNEVAVPEPETAPTSPPTPTTITTAEPSGAGVVSSETGPETETTTDSVTDTATDTAIKIAAPSADEPVQAAATPAVSSIAAPQPLASEDDTAEAGAVGGDIIALAARYCRALDTKDWSQLDEVFLPDATAVLGAPNQLVGRDAIVDRIRTALDYLDDSQHLVGNHEVTIDGNTGTQRCYLQAQHVRAVADGSPNYMIAGRYEDRVQKTPEGWRIAHRTLTVMWSEGNLAVVRP